MNIKQKQFNKQYGWYMVAHNNVPFKEKDGRLLIPSRDELRIWLAFQHKTAAKEAKGLFEWLADYIRVKWDMLAVWRAKVLADANSKKYNGRRFYVLPDWNGNYQVLHKGMIKKMQANGNLPKGLTFIDLINESVYYTKRKDYVTKTKR